MPFSADLLCSFLSLYLCHDKCKRRRKYTTRQLALEIELKRCSSSLSTKIQRESFLETLCSDFRLVLVWAPLPFKKECFRTLDIWSRLRDVTWAKKWKKYNILSRFLKVLVDTLSTIKLSVIREDVMKSWRMLAFCQLSKSKHSGLSENRIRIIPSVNYAVPATRWNWTPWYLQSKWNWSSPNLQTMNFIVEFKRSLQAGLVENCNSLLTKLWVEVRISQHNNCQKMCSCAKF